MATYNLTVDVDQDSAREFNERGYKLCLAYSISWESNTPSQFHVIALAQQVKSLSRIQWMEQHSIAASAVKFADGARIQDATMRIAIKLGQRCDLPEDWSVGIVTDDPEAPRDGFIFENHSTTTSGSAVVYKNIQGSLQPIYIHGAAPLPPRTSERLVPQLKIGVWFGANAEASTMVSTFTTPLFEFSMAKNQSHSAYIKYDGRWTVVSNS